jgi:DNA repair photolyase
VEWLEAPPAAPLEIFEEEAKSILSENKSPDLPFRYSLNPYRGCTHACAYCYARPTHQHLGFGAGTDFDRKIVVKKNAPHLLKRRLEKRSWRGEAIVFSGNTDPYQAIEASYGLTRACLAVCVEYQNPITIITKAALVRRDVDLLARLARLDAVKVCISVAFADDGISKKVERAATRPSRRFETLRILADAGIEVGVAIAPVIVGLNDSDVPELLERGAHSGATFAFMTPLRLPGEALEVFSQRMATEFPDRFKRMENALLEIRRGNAQENRFLHRMRGHGPRWKMVRQVFENQCRRLGLAIREDADLPLASSFQRPKAQGELFDGR